MQYASQALSGEPNKLCDIIATGIVEEYLKRDPDSYVRCHVSGGHGVLFVTGELVSSADFDVSALVRRLLGKYGIHEGIEPFISLEPVVSERVRFVHVGCGQPTVVTGYATQETDAFVPTPVFIARQVAEQLEMKRLQDPDWFWMGFSGSVAVVQDGKDLNTIIVQIDHGMQDLGSVRQAIQQEVEALNLPPSVRIVINPLGAQDQNTLKYAVGRSGVLTLPYGSALPSSANIAGLDWHQVDVVGQMLARHSALKLLECKDAKAVFVRLYYEPGEEVPSRIWARDERGRHLEDQLKVDDLHLVKSTESWLKPGILTEAVMHGTVGSRKLPWDRVA